jgi:hypothetical protein
MVTLPLAEFNALVAEVRQRLDPQSLSALVISCGHSVDEITVPVPWPELAQRVLKAAEKEEWLGELLDAFIQEPNSGPSLKAACTRALEHWRKAQRTAVPFAPAGRRIDALVLFNKAPFVDRVPERPLVEQIVQQVGQRVLVVRGDSAVGKSHLAFFVRHLVDAQPGTKAATLRLDEIDVDVVGALDVMSELASLMGLNPDPNWDRFAQEQRQAGKLARWLAGKTQAFTDAGTHWVVVLDAVNHPKVGPGALELVDQLIMC